MSSFRKKLFVYKESRKPFTEEDNSVYIECFEWYAYVKYYANAYFQVYLKHVTQMLLNNNP